MTPMYKRFFIIEEIIESGKWASTRNFLIELLTRLANGICLKNGK